MPTQRPSRYRVEVLTSPGPRLESRQLAIETYYRCGNFKRKSAIEIPPLQANPQIAIAHPTLT